MGAFSKAVATILTFPYIRAKIILQSQGGKKKNSNELERVPSKSKNANSQSVSNTSEALAYIVKSEGFKGLYKGIEPQLLKGVLAAAVMLMIKEKVFGVTRATLQFALGIKK